jgi:tetratricopeptide (TPR) repeat protein
LRALRVDRWKLIAGPRSELYDLGRDPAERDNLIGDTAQAGRIDRLQREVTRLSSVSGTLANAVPLDGAAAERLRALGYVSGPGTTSPGKTGERAHPGDQLAAFDWYVEELNAAIGDLGASRAATAVGRLRTIVGKYPDSFEGRQYLGYALAAAGDHRAALLEYDRAVTILPTYALAHFNAARSLSALGRPDEARRRVERGLALEPRNAYGHLVAGVIAMEARDPARALAAFEEAVRLNPAAPILRANLAEALMRAGAFDRALEQYEALVHMRFRPAEAQFNIGVIAERLGDPTRARRAYREALAENPALDAARRALADLDRAPASERPRR